jgi:predicted GTPase
MSLASEKIIDKLISDGKIPKDKKDKALKLLKNQKLNILLVGSTGAGKSSTINSLFDINDAHVGLSPYPETMDISRYDLGNLILWDSPGLGDGESQDKEHCKKIINILKKMKVLMR